MLEEKFKIFVTFHQKVPERLYKHLDAKYRRLFTVSAVNQKYEKDYSFDESFQVIREWELTKFDPFLQQHLYYETSTFYHVFHNKLYGDSEYVGFFHYDHVFFNHTFEDVIRTIKSSNARTNVFFQGLQYDQVDYYDKRLHAFFLSHYNQYFGTNFKAKDVQGPWLGMGAFIMPRHLYLKMAPWIVALCDDYRLRGYIEFMIDIKQSGCYNDRHFPKPVAAAYILECAFGFFLCLEKNITMCALHMQHDNRADAGYHLSRKLGLGGPLNERHMIQTVTGKLWLTRLGTVPIWSFVLRKCLLYVMRINHVGRLVLVELTPLTQLPDIMLFVEIWFMRAAAALVGSQTVF